MQTKNAIEMDRDNVPAFLEIVRLLTDFDERTGRHRKMEDPALHYLRKSVAYADPKDLRVRAEPLGNHVFRVYVVMRTDAGRLATEWIHEDGIRAERETFADEPNHPVHNIVCLTDLLQ